MDVSAFFSRLNPVIAWLLRSPLRGLVDSAMLLVTVTGRRSGRRYTIPVGYRRRGDVLDVLVSKAPTKQWWRNYREPGRVEVWLRGEARTGVARVVPSDTEPFRRALEAQLRETPWLRQQYAVPDYDRASGLTDAQWKRAAANAALVEIELDA